MQSENQIGVIESGVVSINDRVVIRAQVDKIGEVISTVAATADEVVNVAGLMPVATLGVSDSQS